jgi:toxin ParE1/3/4
MPDVILRPEAVRDLEDIADYTIDQWGKEQARLYVGELRQSIERLGSTGERYPLVDTLFPGLRRMRSRHHLIYYVVDDRVVEIIRVLHERMDVNARLC